MVQEGGRLFDGPAGARDAAFLGDEAVPVLGIRVGRLPEPVEGMVGQLLGDGVKSVRQIVRHARLAYGPDGPPPR